MPRKLIRPQVQQLRAGPHALPAKRPVPPESTQAEASYLAQAIESKATLVIRLVGGDEIRGRLEYYDRDCLKIEPEGGRKILLRKDKIKYYRVERSPAKGAGKPAPGR